MENFYNEIMLSNENTFYAKLLKEYSNHDVGRIYLIIKQHDKTLYSCDNRGLGHGGYVSNVLKAGYFEKSNQEEYINQPNQC